MSRPCDYRRFCDEEQLQIKWSNIDPISGAVYEECEQCGRQYQRKFVGRDGSGARLYLTVEVERVVDWGIAL